MEVHYYEQVHMALHGSYCPRSKISDGIDICAGGESVAPDLIRDLAGKEELEKALARRSDSVGRKAVSFGVNKDLQHGIHIHRDPHDGMNFILHHPTGAVVKIPESAIKSNIEIPYPGLSDELDSISEKDQETFLEIPKSAEWMGQRVFPQRRTLIDPGAGDSFWMLECRTEYPVYHGHDHTIFVKLSSLSY